MFDQDEFNDQFALWTLEAEIHCPEWPLYKSQQASQLLRERAASFGGYIGLSHFSRAFSELKTAGSIKQLRQPKPPEPEDDELTPEAYRKLSAREVARRYMTEVAFKYQIDNLISKGLI